MWKFRLSKFVFFNKIKTSAIDPFLLRYYEQIITGFWAILVLMPLEQFLDYKFCEPGNISLSLFSKEYLILVISGTLIFALTSSMVPLTKKVHTRIALQDLFKKGLIDAKQKKLIRTVLKHNMLCRSITTKEGFYQFIMTNLFNFGVICAYYAFENAVFVLFKNDGNSSLITASIFMLIFLGIILAEKKIDKSMYGIIEDDDYHNDDKLYGNGKNNKQILLHTMKLVASETFYDKLSYSLLEDSLDDILEILHISSHRESK